MNKREFFRLDIIVNFYYKLIKKEGSSKYSFQTLRAGRVINLSGNGFLFYPLDQDEEILDSTLIFGKISMIHLEEEIPVLCRKVRTINKEMDGMTKEIFALHILEIKPRQQDKIVELLNKEIFY